MIDPNEFAALNSNAHQVYAAQKPQQAKKKTTGRGNKFGSSLISDLGGTGGALGGAAAGAAIGSIVPGVGTAIGGLAGALLGGFGGGTAGQAIENKVRDDQDFLGEGGSAKQALTEGTISGVMGAGPLRLLKGGSSIAKASTKGLAGALVKPVAADGAEQIAKQVTAAPLKTSMAGKADALGDKLLGKSQWGVIGKPGIRANDPAGTSKSMYNMGLTKNTDIERTAQSITGSDGILNKAVSNAVDGANPLQTGHLAGHLQSSIRKSGIVDTQAKGLTNEIAADLDLIDPSDPKSALDVMRNLKARQQEYLGKGETAHLATSLDKKRAKVIGQVHDEIENTLYKTAGANGNLAQVLTPQLEKELLDLHPGNAQWASHVKDNIMSAKSVGDLRHAQAPFVKARKLIDEGEGNKYSAGGQMVNNTGGIKNAIVDGVANMVKQPMQRAAGVVAKKTAPMLPGGQALPSSVPTGLSGALSGITAPTNKAILRNGVLAGAGGAMLGPDTAEAAPLEGEIMPQDGQTDPFNQQGSAQTDYDPIADQELQQAQLDEANDPFNPANLSNNVRKLLAAGGTMDDVKEYMGMVQMMQELSAPAKEAKLNATTAASMASSANGTNTLSQLEQLFGQAGNGSGKLGGGLSNVLSKVGLSDNTQVYNDLAGSSVSQLAKALNGGGQVSDTDAAVVIQALPKITDSPEVAQAKFRALKARLQAAQQNILQFAGGAEQQPIGAF